MNHTKMDLSLSEVRQWREAAQQEVAHIDPDSMIETIQRRAKEFMNT